MPLFLDRTARPLATDLLADRSKKYYIRRGEKFVDPFPFIHGTVPEKMVYAALSRYGIPFLFLNDLNFNIPDLDFSKTYQADFIIPSAQLIIEVQGAYFHSMPKTIESDAFKFAIYEVSGYKALAWWDYDIYERLDALIMAEPALVALMQNQVSYRSTELPAVARTKVDTSKGIRVLNSKRALRKQYKKIIKFKGLFS